jgi:hypothetical protein
MDFIEQQPQLYQVSNIGLIEFRIVGINKKTISLLRWGIFCIEKMYLSYILVDI